jgi:acetylornithine deacetylase/succinyl-diaminopimelate desuccinylase-like protein
MPIPKQAAIDVVELTKQLISIPSFVDRQHDETHLVEFLNNFFKEKLPSLTVEKQYVGSDTERANLVIKGKGTPKLFVLGHLDTVQPTDNWSTDPLEPVIQDGRLYGLGAADMKGSLAAFLCALLEVEATALDDLMVLLYIDEEYDFAGMKRFLKDQKLTQSPPELILSLDGALTLLSGCRGLIEFSARVTGRSGHSSNPKNGINAITGTVNAVQSLESGLAGYSDEYLGDSTVNIAYLRGGVVEHRNGHEEWLREGNVIPDVVDVTVELRTAHNDLDANRALMLFTNEVEERGLSLDQISVRHDLRLWPVSYNSRKVDLLEKCYEDVDMRLQKSDRTKSGFIDVQMIAEVVNSPTFVIGAGGENKHGANENVSVDDLIKATHLYKAILINSM